MAKILRQTDNPQFINKNATLTGAEHDNNFIEFQAEINEARGLGVVEVYDNAKPYQKDEFVVEAFNIFKFISDVAAAGVVPGTDPEKWTLSSLAEILLIKNVEVVTAQELSDLQQAGTLKKDRIYFINDPELFLNRGYQITVSAVESNRLAIQAVINSLVPDFQDIGNYIEVVGFVANLGVWSDTKGTLDYDGLLNGPFLQGDTITGDTSGATAIVESDAPGAGDTGTLTIRFINGTFLDDEDLSNTGAATAVMDGVTTFTFNPVTGNVLIWDGRHYRKKTDTPSSTEPDADGTNYEVLDYSLTNGYILDTDAINIDLSTELNVAFSPSSQYDDFILRRTDKRSNKVYSPLLFQWGNDLTKGNIVYQGGTLDCINTLFPVQFNEIYDGTVIANMVTNSLLNGTIRLRGATFDISGAETDREHDGRVFTTEVRIKAVDVSTLNSVRIFAISRAGAKKGIEIISATGKIDKQGAGTPYDTNIDVDIIADTATKPLMTLLGILAATTDQAAGMFKNDAVFTPADTQVMKDEDVFIQVPVGEPQNGVNDLRVFITYRIINMNC